MNRRLEQAEKKYEQVQLEEKKLLNQLQQIEEKLKKIQDKKKEAQAERAVALVAASAYPFEDLKELILPTEKGEEHVHHHG